jgi:hypothetical protein
LQEWRNWQTRWTQNPVNLKFVRVRLPPLVQIQSQAPKVFFRGFVVFGLLGEKITYPINSPNQSIHPPKQFAKVGVSCGEITLVFVLLFYIIIAMPHNDMFSREELKRQNILFRWGLTVEELTTIVDANPSMRGLMMGYVAEYKLRKLFFENERFTSVMKDDDHDRKSKGDLRVVYRGKLFRIECKSLQSNSIRTDGATTKATFQCDASDKRTVRFRDGSEIQTTCLLRGEFDIVAVNMFVIHEEWLFAFAKNSDLPSSSFRKYTDLQQQELLASSVKITYPLQAPFRENPYDLLDQIIDGA